MTQYLIVIDAFPNFRVLPAGILKSGRRGRRERKLD
jgi:hypothetical protein